MAFIIQSTSFSTGHLDQRCEAFLQGFRQTLQDMDEASFAKQVRGCRQRLGTASAAAEGARGIATGGAEHRCDLAAAPSADMSCGAVLAACPSVLICLLIHCPNADLRQGTRASLTHPLPASGQVCAAHWLCSAAC